MQGLIRYLYQIQPGKVILWCYLIWYLTITYFYFDPAPKLWINSLGISAVIGTGLMLSVSAQSPGSSNYWQIFRLYMMPFCVSSFSALIKGQGFFVFVSPRMIENLLAILFCGLFLSAVLMIKFAGKTYDR